MAFVTPISLKDKVRDYADQPDDGDGQSAYVTDTMIYQRLSAELRRILKKLAQNGVYIGVTTQASSPASSIALTQEAICILNVSQDNGSSRQRLQRLRDSDDPRYPTSTTYARYWRPLLSITALPSVELFPTPTAGTMRITYIPEPAAFDDGSGSMYLPQSWQDAMVLGAAMRCYAREDGSNAWLAAMYREAMEEIELDAAQFSAADAAVIRNSDMTYSPGGDQSQVILDPSDFWYSP